MPEAQAWLLDRFSRRMRVQSIPRTMLVEIRFRSRDAALSAAIVNALIAAYGDQETESQIEATAQASGWLARSSQELKIRTDNDQRRLAEFENQHGIVSTPEVMANGQPGETEHSSALLEIDELSRQLVAATTDRILAEAEFVVPRKAIRRRSSPLIRACRPTPPALPLRSSSRFAPAAATSSRNKLSSAPNTVPAFHVLLKSAASWGISTGRSRPKTQSSSSASAPICKPPGIASNWSEQPAAGHE